MQLYQIQNWEKWMRKQWVGKCFYEGDGWNGRTASEWRFWWATWTFDFKIKLTGYSNCVCTLILKFC